MLNESGKTATDRHLPGEDVHSLRLQLTERLDAAGANFRETHRRTIIVVDGLDHVDRDYSGPDNLLSELPRPEELPTGVVIVVGSRTLNTLNIYARQQIADRQSEIDLMHHRLSPKSVLAICRRSHVTKDLPIEVHDRIVDLSGGHPLALSYLLNRIRETEGSPFEALSDAPPYTGDVAADYLALWTEIEHDDHIVEILSVCSRLRVGFTTQWLAEWNEPAVLRKFRRNLMYLFRHECDGLRFFHDSFRQFAADRTALVDELNPDARADAHAHSRIADLCAKSAERRVKDERIFHLYYAGRSDEVLNLCHQQRFRNQSIELRSPSLIHEDIALALDTAAERQDVLAMLRCQFSLVELNQKTLELENVNMPLLFCNAGLVEHAIEWSGRDHERVPLAHAYELAATLGKSSNPAGRRIFDMIDHYGTDDPNRTPVSGTEDEAAVAWTRAAVLFRPLTIVIDVISREVADHSVSRQRVAQRRRHNWSRYRQMIDALIDELSSQDDESGLTTIDSSLDGQLTQLKGSTSERDSCDEPQANREPNQKIATVIDLRVRLLIVLVERAAAADLINSHLRALLLTLSDGPRFVSTILDASEVLARYGIRDESDRLMGELPYRNAISVDALSYGGQRNAISCHFRYWRLRHLLAPSAEEVPDSVPQVTDLAEGTEVDRRQPERADIEAMELAARVDSAVRQLGRFDAATISGQPVTEHAIWTAISAMLSIFPSRYTQRTAAVIQISQRKSELFTIMSIVARNYGHGLPQRLSDTLTQRFQSQREQWPIQLRLDLGDELRSAGISVPWYRSALAEWETNLSSESVEIRLDDAANLVAYYGREGDQESARRLVLSLIPMAFGVGFRKDYQFDSWVSWIGKAIRGQGGEQYIEHAAWLARLIIAVDPMTEGAPASAATDLPAKVVPANPMAAVRIFEYLVRHRAVDHLRSLASLVCELLSQTGADGIATVELAADITAQLLAPASNQAYPRLASSLVSAVESVGGGQKARTLAKSVASRTDIYALPTTRNEWRRGLGLPSIESEQDDSTQPARRPSNDDDYGALVLSDGRRIARDDVASHIQSIDDIIALRRDEARDSSFSWSPVIEHHNPGDHNIQELIALFDDGSKFSLDALVSLSQHAERNGDFDTALRLADTVLRAADGTSWSRHFGGTLQSAAAVAVRLGGHDVRVSTYKQLARELSSSGWLPRMLLDELDVLIESLGTQIDPATVWLEIRTHLEGIALSLKLPDPSVLADHGCHWWMMHHNSDRRATTHSSTPTVALAELLVGHLSHPTWLVRDASTAIIIRALVKDIDEVAHALARFAQPDASDDTLERVGRCLAGARSGAGRAVSIALQPLEQSLASHSSQVLRDLSIDPSRRIHRSLSPLYRLVFPPQTDKLIGSDPVLLEPYRALYGILANETDIELSSLNAIALKYASDALATLPREETIKTTIHDISQIQHSYPSVRLAASRSAFGRILADVRDAGLFDHLPPRVRLLFRTVDMHALTRLPIGRPRLFPSPPPSGHDQNAHTWRDEIEDRLSQYVAASTCGDLSLIGARSHLTVLNWGHLEEEFLCGAAIGFNDSTEDVFVTSQYSITIGDLPTFFCRAIPRGGEPLIIENLGYTFHQLRADYLSFRPDLAASLGWNPATDQPSAWLTTTGDLAVETIWWTDGWWGRVGPAFDNTEAEGQAVIVTDRGLAEIVALFGPITRHFRLTRGGRDDGTRVESLSVERCLPLGVSERTGGS